MLDALECPSPFLISTWRVQSVQINNSPRVLPIEVFLYRPSVSLFFSPPIRSLVLRLKVTTGRRRTFLWRARARSFSRDRQIALRPLPPPHFHYSFLRFTFPLPSTDPFCCLKERRELPLPFLPSPICDCESQKKFDLVSLEDCLTKSNLVRGTPWWPRSPNFVAISRISEKYKHFFFCKLYRVVCFS